MRRAPLAVAVIIALTVSAGAPGRSGLASVGAPSDGRAAQTGNRLAASPKDHLVALRHLGAGRYVLTEVVVDPNGQLTRAAQVALPTGPAFAGPVLSGPDTCVLLGIAEGPEEVTVYEWRVGEAQVRPGRAVRGAFRERSGWPVAPTSYSHASRRVLVTPAAPEGMADAPLVWDFVSSHPRSLATAYPALGLARRSWVTAACFSPDGSLLAAAVSRAGPRGSVGLLVYDLRHRQLRKLAGPRQYVWMLAISPTNDSLLWVDTGLPYGLAMFEQKRTNVRLDRYNDAGYGVLSLHTGKARYRRFSADPEFGRVWGTREGLLTDQYRSTSAFSSDGARLYLLFGELARLDRRSGQWKVFAGEELGGTVGFALVPDPSSQRRGSR